MELSGLGEDLGVSYPNWVLPLLLLLLLLLSSLGLVSVLKAAVSFLNWVYVYLLRPPKNLRDYGSWAIVTGSTDGIGRAFAFRLAMERLDLVLLGRCAEKLQRVSDDIRATHHGVRTKTVVMDFSGNLEDGVLRLRDAVDGLDVGVLVNNAGATYPGAMYFHEVEEETWRNVVKVNIEGLAMVTQAVLPTMLRKRKGAIVNIGSASAAAIPSNPLYAVYTATKAYVDSFSASLHVEYKRHGIDVQCQMPLYVATKMVPFDDATFFIPTPKDYAQAAIRQIGYEPRCTPYWRHSLQWWLVSMVPKFVLNELRLRRGINLRKAKKTMHHHKHN